MSRSQPHDHAAHPVTRWFEWNGEAGTIKYYDKAKKETIECSLPFSFMLLDQLGTVGGWHEASTSGIHANEVRDTRQDVLVVKAYKGGVLAEGLYAAIKDRVNTAGGSFVANCYIAWRDGEGLALGSIKFKGAALGAWMEFTKKHRADLYKKAIVIGGYTEGKKGRVIYRMPAFAVKDVSVESDRAAVLLDEELQAYLTGYFRRTTRDQMEAPKATEPDAGESYFEEAAPADFIPTADDIPFAVLLPLVALSGVLGGLA
jgi:hypothetical protein